MNYKKSRLWTIKTFSCLWSIEDLYALYGQRKLSGPLGTQEDLQVFFEPNETPRSSIYKISLQGPLRKRIDLKVHNVHNGQEKTPRSSMSFRSPSGYLWTIEDLAALYQL